MIHNGKKLLRELRTEKGYEFHPLFVGIMGLVLYIASGYGAVIGA